jgi:predicted ester cyclase
MASKPSAENAEKTLVRYWFEEVWNQGREELIDELLAPEVPVSGLAEGDTVLHGNAEFRTFYRNIRGTLPDIHITVEDLISEGEKIAVRLSVEGTHMGDALAPATGRTVKFMVLVMARVANGKLAEAWNSVDQLGLLTQIGALAAPGSDRFMKRPA